MRIGCHYQKQQFVVFHVLRILSLVSLPLVLKFDWLILLFQYSESNSRLGLSTVVWSVQRDRSQLSEMGVLVVPKDLVVHVFELVVSECNGHRKQLSL